MKKLILLLFTGISLSACMYNNPELEQISNEKVVRQYFDHFNQHDWSKMAGLYSEIAEFKDPSLGKSMVKQSRQQVIKKYTELGQAFPNVTDSIIHIYPSGPHHVTVEFLSTGTGQDQSKFEIPICTIFTIKEGQIIKDYTYYDNF